MASWKVREHKSSKGESISLAAVHTTVVVVSMRKQPTHWEETSSLLECGIVALSGSRSGFSTTKFMNTNTRLGTHLNVALVQCVNMDFQKYVSTHAPAPRGSTCAMWEHVALNSLCDLAADTCF